MKNNLLMTAAMAGMLMTTGACATSNGASDAKVGKCYGINACKGHGDCAGKVDACNGADGCSGKSSCKGTNSCKGKGFKKMTKNQCHEKGGDFKG